MAGGEHVFLSLPALALDNLSMSIFRHCHSTRAPSPSALYWQSYMDAFAFNKWVINETRAQSLAS
jgi:hypothetical protein